MSDRGSSPVMAVCAICFEPMDDPEIAKTLHCSHSFHTECIAELQSTDINQSCPLCRAPLPPTPAQLFKEGLQRFSALHHRYGAGGERPWRRKVARSDMREFREAMRMLEDAAEQNNAEAQFNIGTIHAHGHGVLVNNEVAVNYFRRAADQGNPDAQCNMGFMSRKGKGVEQSDAAAAAWYLKAADQGLAQAQVNLGYLYMSGIGVEASDSIAMRWFTAAQAQGFSTVQPFIDEIRERERRRHATAAATTAAADATAAAAAQASSPPSSASMPRLKQRSTNTKNRKMWLWMRGTRKRNH